MICLPYPAYICVVCILSNQKIVSQIVQKLVRILPNGQQVKREVDFVLDECFETMSPMHFHIREVIFVTYNKVSKNIAYKHCTCLSENKNIFF